MSWRLSIIVLLLFNWSLVSAQSSQDDLDKAIEILSDSVSVIDDELYEADYPDDYDENEYIEEVTQDDYYEQRNVSDKKWTKYKKDKRFNYKIKPKKKEKPKKKTKDPWTPDLSFFNSTFFKVILYIIVVGLLGFVVFLFFKNNQFSFKRKVKKTSEVETPWEEVESFEDWELALQKAVQEGDFRLATRILYLQTLQKLNRQSLIDYSEEKTNWHYVQKLFGTTYHEPFMKLTTYFDYIWYGNYNVEQERYNEVKNSFLTFHNTMHI